MNAIDESLPLRNWTQSAGEEVANGISHGIGLVGAMIGTPILLLAALHHSNIPFLIGTIIFTSTMLLVYLASTLYHCWPRTHTKSLLQVLDHSAIFLLIAGTYTPFALGPLHGYGIARRIEQISDDVLRLNEGTVYAALLRLGQNGWISAAWGISENNRKAKFYSITRAGRKKLASETANWDRISGVIIRLLQLAGER